MIEASRRASSVRRTAPRGKWVDLLAAGEPLGDHQAELVQAADPLDCLLVAEPVGRHGAEQGLGRLEA
jgi:hypothetical protein